MIAPSTNRIVNPFGWLKGYSLHQDGMPGAPLKPGAGYGYHIGIDFAAGPDPYIYLPEDATITCKPNNGTDGNGIYWTTGDRKMGICHAERFLGPSGFYKAGTKIAIIGYTGYVEPAGPDGAHCHFAIQQNGIFIGPTQFITGGKGATTQLQEQDMITITKPIAELLTLSATGWPDPYQDGGAFVSSLINQTVDEAGMEKMLNDNLASPQRKDLIAKLVAGAEAVTKAQSIDGATPRQRAAERAIDALEAAWNTK
jgi:hypothetical protein